ncbi:hypothetical protein JYB62_02125 [Algoriphagus lutimaris]|uniref:hypothetical protein n=1 Tax=Algoriphagus lutimaris TaxID=613197 RepID=UPI00196B2BAB|nr:hypothetical protein [Algoriphagus lutimaris]MBN3518786.1 hypothetical protein [Algoriphagus lutimaris]
MGLWAWALPMDYDGDGDMDLLVNCVNVSLFEKISQKSDKVIFKHGGPLSDKMLVVHTTSPTFIDWNKEGIWGILVGAQDVHFTTSRDS